MKTSSEYPFVPTGPEELAALLTQTYESLTGTAVRQASPERLFIQWMAAVITQERVLANYIGNQNIPSRAEGENLDALAELTNCRPRPQAERAVCTMRFFLSQAQPTAILIPAGTRVAGPSGGLFWETLSDAYVPAGEICLDVPVRCQTAGTVGNGYGPGQIRTIVDVFDFYTSCENITVTEGGADRASDGEYRELPRASMDSYSCAGARGGYVYFAKQVSTEIVDVIAASPTPGTVKLYVLMRGGSPAGEEIKSAVLTACSADEVRPLTDFVSVEDPEIVPYGISFTYYIPAGSVKSGTEIAAAVRAAVEEYVSWQCGKLGRDINPSYLIGLLMQTGIKRVALAAPAFLELRDGSGKTAPQLAALRGTVDIVSGGYENE